MHWHFVAPEQPGGPGRVQLDGGFQPGTLYELIYKAKDPYVTGAGLAGYPGPSRLLPRPLI
jgi:hypothetical protein